MLSNPFHTLLYLLFDLFTIRLVKENPRWGYLRIVGELFKLRIKLGKISVRRILLEEGLYPHPTSGDRTYRPGF